MLWIGAKIQQGDNAVYVTACSSERWSRIHSWYSHIFLLVVFNT